MHDLVIVGGGPAGMTAGIYAQRAMLDAVVYEKQALGGQMLLSTDMENYPGIVGKTGPEIAQKIKEHALSLGVKTKNESINEVSFGDEITLKTDKGEIKTKSLIIATGSQPRRLKIPGEEKFTGAGVSYCATCDGYFFKEKHVAVIGGGNSAVEEALLLSKTCAKVTLIHRRDCFRADAVLADRAKKTDNIKIILDTVAEEIKGEKMVEKLVLKNVKNEEVSEIVVNGVFIYVGKQPDTKTYDVKKNKTGFIVTDENMKTSVKRVFAAGDCRLKVLRQVTTAVGDGAQAAFSAVQYLSSGEQKKEPTADKC